MEELGRGKAKAKTHMESLDNVLKYLSADISKLMFKIKDTFESRLFLLKMCSIISRCRSKHNTNLCSFSVCVCVFNHCSGKITA